MGLFDIFKKKEKIYICARCKKEITDEESKWIGNHRFCSNCAAPPKASSISKPLKETKDTFICQNCGEELASKYMHRNKICVKCASKMDRQDNPKNSATQNNKDVIFLQANRPERLYRDKKFLRKLFTVYFNGEEQHEKFVCYDTITGIPYLIDSQTKYAGHAIISSWFGQKLTYEQVALFAQNYAPTNPLTSIHSDNWKKFFNIDNTTQQNPSAYTDSITRESNMVFLSDIAYVGTIIPIQLDWCDIEGSQRFSFAGAPHFDEISVGVIKQGKYMNQLFITIINDGYPSGNGCGTAELLPESHHSYEGVKRYVEGRGFSVYQPISEKTYNENIKELIL